MVGLRNGAGEDLNVTAVAGVINAPSAFYRGYPIQNLTGLVSLHCAWLGLDTWITVLLSPLPSISRLRVNWRSSTQMAGFGLCLTSFRLAR